MEELESDVMPDTRAKTFISTSRHCHENENVERWFKPRGLCALRSRYDLFPGGQALNIIDVVSKKKIKAIELASNFVVSVY